MSSPDKRHPALKDDEGWYLTLHGHNNPATSVLLWLSPPVDDDAPENCISLNVEGLTALSQLAAEWAQWLAVQTGETVPEALPADDRERRIRELAREWVGRHGGTRQVEPTDVERLIGRAAEFIDALDAAEVPPKDAGGES